MDSTILPEGRDDLAKLPMDWAGKRLARKHGLKDMTNTRIWDRMTANILNKGSSKLSIKDKGTVTRAESLVQTAIKAARSSS